VNANITTLLDTSAELGTQVQHDHLPAVLLFQRVVSGFDFVRISYQKSFGFLPGAFKAARQATRGNGTTLAVSQALYLAGLLIGKRIKYGSFCDRAQGKPDGSLYTQTTFSIGPEIQVTGTWEGRGEHG